MGWGERYETDEEKQEVHVLAVDDSFVDRKVIERLLRSSACKVTVVESGRRALQLLGLDEEKKGRGDFHDLNPKVDMVITDYCMPGMTGYELLKRIKESSALREIPVIVMSSEKIVARIDRCMEEGAEEFLLKPVKLSDVKRLKDNMRRGEFRPRNESRAARKRKHEDKHSSAEQNSSSSSKSSPSSSPPPSLSTSPLPTNVSGPHSPTPSISGSPRRTNQNGLLTAEGISDIF